MVSSMPNTALPDPAAYVLGAGNREDRQRDQEPVGQVLAEEGNEKPAGEDSDDGIADD